MASVPYYLTPIMYVVFPPDMPARREMMDDDSDTVPEPLQQKAG